MLTTPGDIPINTFGDILAAMERDPELCAEMRRHILGEEILRLPETVANLAQTVREILDVVRGISERQDRMEGQLGRMEEWQDRVEGQLGRMEERQDRVEGQLGRMEERQDRVEGQLGRMEERQDRMEGQLGRMEERQDRVEGQLGRMEERQDRVEGQLGRMEERQDRMEQDITDLKAGQSRMEQDITDLKAGQSRMQGQLNNLMGTDYERKVARRLRRTAERRLNLRAAEVIYAVVAPDNNTIPDLLSEALDAGRIDNDQIDEVERADLIISGRNQAGGTTYAVVETSITIDRRDIDRAAVRATLLERASDATALAVVVGTDISDADRSHAGDNGVAVIVMLE